MPSISFGDSKQGHDPDESQIGPAKLRGDDKGHEPSIGALIDAMGVGWYQVQVWILSAGFIASEGSCVLMAAALSPSISDHYRITSGTGKSFLMMLVLSGLGIGTFTAGPLGDNFGRRLPMLVGYVGLVLTAVATTSAIALRMVDMMFFFLGVFGGVGIPAAVIAISEVTPSHLRGISTAGLGLACSLGEVWASTGLRWMMPDLEDGPWHLLVLWAVAPATLLLCFGLSSRVTRYDTPHFLAAKERSADLMRVLRLIAEMNGASEVLKRGVQLQSEGQKGMGFDRALGLLFTRPYFQYTVVLAALFFIKDIAMCGLSIFWPLAWRQIGSTTLGMTSASELILTSMLGIPGYLLSMAFIYNLPRRVVLSFAAGISCWSAFLLRYLLMGHPVGLVGVLCLKLSAPTWVMTTVLLASELYPTQVRVWAFSIVGLVGKVAAILAPSLVSRSIMGFLWTIMIMMLIVSVIIWTLPETKDVKLTSFNGDCNNAEFQKTPEKTRDVALNYGALKNSCGHNSDFSA